jgi:hypothetical protein
MDSIIRTINTGRGRAKALGCLKTGPRPVPGRSDEITLTARVSFQSCCATPNAALARGNSTANPPGKSPSAGGAAISQKMKPERVTSLQSDEGILLKRKHRLPLKRRISDARRRRRCAAASRLRLCPLRRAYPGPPPHAFGPIIPPGEGRATGNLAVARRSRQTQLSQF